MPPTADADAELAREQAAEASALWAVGDFDAAQQTLQRLEATLPGDARVQLNLWVTGYHADASTSLDSVAKELEAWLKAHPADAGDFTQHNCHAVAAVNYGLILFLQQQHASALAVLEPLFDNVDILQDGTALCLCALLLEIYLDSCQLPKAVEVLQYLQRQCPPQGFPGLGGQAGPEAATGEAGSSSSSQGQQLRAGSRSPRKQHEREGQKEAGAAAAGGGSADQGSAQQLGGNGQQQDAVVPLSQALPTTSKTLGKRMQEIFQLVQQKGGKIAGRDLAPLLHLYTARLALACHNRKAAKKEVRGLLSCDPDSPEGLLLKAQLETCKQQPRKALKTLAPLLSTQHQHTIRCRLQLLNLLAAVHHQLDKHHVAALYLSTALNLHAEAQQQQNPQPPAASKPEPQRKQQNKRQQKKQQQQQQQGKGAAAGADAAPAPTATPAATAQSGSSGGAEAAAVVPRQNHWLLPDMSDALHYNLGLQQLALQDWQAAMECFEAASSKYFTLPQLWLRWAEACIGLYHQQQQQFAAEVARAQAGGSSGGGAIGKGKGGGKQGRGQPPSKKQLQQQQQLQQQLISSSEQLLQQAAAHLSTGLVILQEQQAAAAKQLEAVTAAAAAAAAAGEPPPDFATLPTWPGSSAAAGVGPGGAAGGAAASSSFDPGASSSPAAAAAASGGAISDAGPSTPTAGSTAAGPPSTVFSSLPPEAALLAPELAALKQALLTNKAYVALAQNQPAEALSAAQELVACSSMSPHQHYLGSSYAAEALLMLERVDEAKHQLQAHMELFMNSSSAGGLPGVPAGLQQQGLMQQHAWGTAGPSGFSAGAADGIGGSLFGTAAAAGASGLGLQNPAMGIAPGPVAVPGTHPTAGSTKSFDGSCISCSRGVCAGHGGQAGVSGPNAGLGPEQHASVLHNMGALLMLQGNYQEGHRHAAMAAQLQFAGAQQDGLGGMQLPLQVPGQQVFMPGGPGL